MAPQREHTMHAHACARQHTYMHTSLMKNMSLTGRHLMVYNYRNVSFPQLNCMCITIFMYYNIRSSSVSSSGSIHFGSLLSSINGRQTEQRARAIVSVVPLTLGSVFVIADIDECELPTLHHCPPSAGCNNTLGSYRCICHPGYVDADPSNPGASCKGWIISSSF